MFPPEGSWLPALGAVFPELRPGLRLARRSSYTSSPDPSPKALATGEASCEGGSLGDVGSAKGDGEGGSPRDKNQRRDAASLTGRADFSPRENTGTGNAHVTTKDMPKGHRYQERRHVRGHRLSARGAYYHLRTTTRGRIPYLGSNACKQVVVNVLRRVSVRLKFDVVAYVVMPEHVHLIVHQRGGQGISDLMAALKRESAHRINLLLHRKGSVWRKEFYDHMLHSWEHADELVRYIHDNPVRRGLVQAAQDWEFSSWREIYGDARDATSAALGAAPERGDAAPEVAPSEA